VTGDINTNDGGIVSTLEGANVKTFEQLTATQQAKAIENCLTDLLTGITEGGIQFNDKLNKDNLQARIDAACAKAEKMQTPWFAHEYILDTCRDELESIARATAEAALYSEHENVIDGIA
jgi:hypothetical protein